MDILDFVSEVEAERSQHCSGVNCYTCIAYTGTSQTVCRSKFVRVLAKRKLEKLVAKGERIVITPHEQTIKLSPVKIVKTGKVRPIVLKSTAAKITGYVADDGTVFKFGEVVDLEKHPELEELCDVFESTSDLKAGDMLKVGGDFAVFSSLQNGELMIVDKCGSYCQVKPFNAQKVEVL